MAQVVKLQAELAYVQARLSTSQRIPFASPLSLPHSATSDTHTSIMHFDHLQPLPPSLQLPTFLNSDDQQLDVNGGGDRGDLQDSAQEFVSSYYLAGGGRFRPSNNH